MKSVAVAPSAFASAHEHAISIREKGVSCRELVELYIGRIHHHNPALVEGVVCNLGRRVREMVESRTG
jgi:Asp-tRNA(Asn)/Glu-tRNA(Gln) amidotransferase A subunit family amidase